MKAHYLVWVMATILVAFASPSLRSQSLAGAADMPVADPGDRSAGFERALQIQPADGYTRPGEVEKFHDYLFQAFGPLPAVEAVVMGSIHQATNTPPDWRQGWPAFGERVGSDFGISAVQNTARYGLAEITREDTRYYPCGCKGFLSRLGRAAVSTLIARRGADGHSIFSVPDLVAPYAGTMTAVYGWYPNRYGMKDAFRMGNYSLAGYMASNITLEFLPPHPRLARLHLNNRHGAPETGSSR